MDEQKSEQSEFVFQNWMPQANWTTPTEIHVPRVATQPDLGGEFVQGHAVRGRETEEREDGPWTDSQQNLAALLE